MSETRSLDDLLVLALDETREAFERLPPIAMAPWVNNSGEVVRADPHHAGCCAARAHTFVRLAQGRAEDLRARAERAEAEVARLREVLRECVHVHNGTHSEDCHAFGAGSDEDLDPEATSPDPHCDCGATAKRESFRAALADSEKGET